MVLCLTTIYITRHIKERQIHRLFTGVRWTLFTVLWTLLSFGCVWCMCYILVPRYPNRFRLRCNYRCYQTCSR